MSSTKIKIKILTFSGLYYLSSWRFFTYTCPLILCNCFSFLFLFKPYKLACQTLWEECSRAADVKLYSKLHTKTQTYYMKWVGC